MGDAFFLSFAAGSKKAVNRFAAAVHIVKQRKHCLLVPFVDRGAIPTSTALSPGPGPVVTTDNAGELPSDAVSESGVVSPTGRT